jgi:4-hydroxy-4-methyl-2-oxoglutarate aldolase
MDLTINDAPETPMTEAELAPWRQIPTAAICDGLGEAVGLCAGIKPLAPGMRFAGQALTVKTAPGSNAAIHHGMAAAWPGAALIVDAGGRTDCAVWGGVLNMSAEARGVVGLVIDGAVRDAADLRAGGLAVFARGIVPNGPNKEPGGGVNIAIRCGGIDIEPGDLVVGDDDGVVVVAPDKMEGLMERCRARMEEKRVWRQKVTAGAATADLWNLPKASG